MVRHRRQAPPPNDGLAALNGGGIDAFASYGTSIITAHQQGATTVGSGKDILSGNFLWSARDSVLDEPRPERRHRRSDRPDHQGVRVRP